MFCRKNARQGLDWNGARIPPPCPRPRCRARARIIENADGIAPAHGTRNARTRARDGHTFRPHIGLTYWKR
jgi:hypothetical protein